MKDKHTPMNSGPLAYLGDRLIDNGYAIVPIAVGKKAPGFDNWEKSRSTKPQLQEWIESGHLNSGVGILTTHTPAIDLDIRDEDIALLAEQKCIEMFGAAPVRIGMAPKRLLLFRTDEPFKKLRSAKYIDDEWMQLHQVEILGDGQQFVAYHIHPDTGKPYVWTEEKLAKDGSVVQAGGPLSINANDLPHLSVEQAREFIQWFDEMAREVDGWKVHRKGRSSAVSGEIDLDDPWIEDTPIVDIDDVELRNRLLLVPHTEDYDVWFQVGMALYHQYDGDEKGRELWHEWSETADNYDADALDRKWDTFDVDGKKRAPLTARYILQLSKEAMADKTVQLSLKLRDEFQAAKTLQEWEKARNNAREAEIDGLARAALAGLAKDRLDIITGTKTPLSEVKKSIAYQPAKKAKTPGWAATWVYDTSDDRFFCTQRKISTSKQGFDAMYDRKAMTTKDVLDGRSAPSSNASALALNMYHIPTVQGRRYEPGRDPIFHTTEGQFANTYPEHEIPELPETLLPRDKKAILRVKNHVRHLLTDKRERRLFVDWLSWIVQNPGKHANWSILLQGTEGDGKSFVGFLMRAVMGVTNVRMLNAHVLEHPFTDWAVGQCLTCVEEVRLIKHTNKYEIINRMKPYVTNNVVDVHPKGGKPYVAVNTTSYLLFTNFRDALPLDDDGRRYCVLFSQWQSKRRLDEFKTENPNYYVDLYRTIETSAPALRKWLLEHEQDENFQPLGDAPETNARKYMIRQNQPEFVTNMLDLIADQVHPLISEALLSVSVLSDKLMMAGYDVPQPKAMVSMLARVKFDELGRFRVKGGDRHYFYSKSPEIWQVRYPNGEILVDSEKIRKFVTDNSPDDDPDDEI